jgi:hypothetical protein
MAAEHGILGVAALVLLIVLGVKTFLQTRTLMARAFVVAMLIWMALFLAINAMRIAAPAFLLGLACSIAYSSIPLRKPTTAAEATPP